MPIEANRCGNRPFILCMASCGGRDGGRPGRWAGRLSGRWPDWRQRGQRDGAAAAVRALRRWYRKHVGSRIMSWAFGVARKAAAVLPRSRRLRAVSTISEPRVLGLPTCAARAGAGGGRQAGSEGVPSGISILHFTDLDDVALLWQRCAVAAGRWALAGRRSERPAPQPASATASGAGRRSERPAVVCCGAGEHSLLAQPACARVAPPDDQRVVAPVLGPLCRPVLAGDCLQFPNADATHVSVYFGDRALDVWRRPGGQRAVGRAGGQRPRTHPGGRAAFRGAARGGGRRRAARGPACPEVRSTQWLQPAAHIAVGLG